MFWIGLYLDGPMVKWAKVNQQKKKVVIELLRTFPVAEDSSFSFPRSGIEEYPYELISGLDTSEILLRTLQVDLTDSQKIIKSLPFQIEPLIPFPQEEAIISAHIYPENHSKSSKIFFYGAKKSSLAQHIDFLQMKNADPDEVSCVPAALWRFTKYFFPELTHTLTLYLGAKTSTLLGTYEGKPLFSHAFSLGSESFFQAMESEGKDACSLDLASISEEKSPVLYHLTEQAKKELDRVFTFFLKKFKEPYPNIVLCGNFSSCPALKNFFLKQIPETIQIHECVGNDSYDATTLETYAIPIGLALEGLSKDGDSTHFRNQASSSRQKRKKKLFFSFALACLVLTSCSLLINNMYRDYKQKTFLQQLYSSFSLSNKKIESLTDLEVELSSLERSLKKEKVPYPLSLPLPNVSEVLAWLSSHPLLITKSSSEEGAIDIKKMQYFLIKHPKANDTKAPYAAKVELEIEFPSVQTAKAFQDSLHKDISFVDTKKEISWQAKGSTYFICFFLKPNPL